MPANLEGRGRPRLFDPDKHTGSDLAQKAARKPAGRTRSHKSAWALSAASGRTMSTNWPLAPTGGLKRSNTYWDTAPLTSVPGVPRYQQSRAPSAGLSLSTGRAHRARSGSPPTGTPPSSQRTQAGRWDLISSWSPQRSAVTTLGLDQVACDLTQPPGLFTASTGGTAWQASMPKKQTT